MQVFSMKIASRFFFVGDDRGFCYIHLNSYSKVGLLEFDLIYFVDSLKYASLMTKNEIKFMINEP